MRNKNGTNADDFEGRKETAEAAVAARNGKMKIEEKKVTAEAAVAAENGRMKTKDIKAKAEMAGADSPSTTARSNGNSHSVAAAPAKANSKAAMKKRGGATGAGRIMDKVTTSAVAEGVVLAAATGKSSGKPPPAAGGPTRVEKKAIMKKTTAIITNLGEEDVIRKRTVPRMTMGNALTKAAPAAVPHRGMKNKGGDLPLKEDENLNAPKASAARRKGNGVTEGSVASARIGGALPGRIGMSNGNPRIEAAAPALAGAARELARFSMLETGAAPPAPSSAGVRRTAVVRAVAIK